MSSLVILAIVAAMRWKHLTQLEDTPRIVLLTSLIMLSFVTLCLEHFFTRPTDVLASTLSIILLLTPLHIQLANLGIWYWILIGYSYLLMILALGALFLVDAAKPPEGFQNRFAGVLKIIAVHFGTGRFLFFALFVVSLLSQRCC